MISSKLRRNKFINDFLFFSVCTIVTIFFFIFYLSIKNDCLFLQKEIYHLEKIRTNQKNKVQVVSGKVHNLLRQDYIEKIAYKKFKMFVPNPESLIVYMEN